LNCGQPAPERYCPQCGQPTSRPNTVREWLLDVGGELFKLDSSLWHTLATLIRHPGKLSSDYVAGKRASQLAPLKLYFFVSAVYATLYINFTPDLVRDRQPGDGLGLGELFHGLLPDEVIGRRMDQFLTFLYANLALIYVALLPVIALMMHILCLRSRKSYLDNLVFTTHFETLIFVFLCAEPFLEPKGLDWICYLIPMLTLPVAMHQFYKVPWVSATLRSFGFIVGLTLTIMISMGLLCVGFIALGK
jgi:hypothetical protein